MRHLNIIDILWAESTLGERTLEHLALVDEMNDHQLSKYAYEMRLESDGYDDPDFHIVTNPQWVADDVTDLVKSLLTRFQTDVRTVAAVYSTIYNHEYKWQNENLHEIHHDFCVNREACRVDMMIDAEKEGV